ncbi:unnamed protein product [Amaranthus hypochondriacus]
MEGRRKVPSKTTTRGGGNTWQMPGGRRWRPKTGGGGNMWRRLSAVMVVGLGIMIVGFLGERKLGRLKIQMVLAKTVVGGRVQKLTHLLLTL